MQAVIKASQAAAKGVSGGKIAQAYIPTPDAVKADVPYKELYPSVFVQPATYIRFSSTVEDCTGTSYCMSEEDEVFLEKLNGRREDGKRCSEDQFEAVMNAYEETSQSRQPFASVDNTPVLAFEEMVSAFDEFESEDLDEVARVFAEEIYHYWKERKIEKSSKSLMPKLKTLNMDQPNKDADDSDPYVCFRRREVKQMRRTRGRDSQVVERLKKLRRELEEGRQLLHWVKHREETRREDFKVSRHMFEQRSAVRELKRSLNITDDDEELLVNQRTPKRRPQEVVQPSRQMTQMPRRQDSVMNMPDTEFIQYAEKLKQREDAIKHQIQKRLHDYEKWNLDFVDHTQDVLEGLWSPQDEFEEPQSQWVSIKPIEIPQEPQQQPTPPESVVEGDPMDEDKPEDNHYEHDQSNDEPENVQISWTTPPDTDSSEDQNHPRTVYRRRRGRGGMMLDQRKLRGRPPKSMDAKTLERMKYDVDSGEEDDVVDRLDPSDSRFFRLRQHLRGFEARQRNAQQQGGYHSRNGSLASSQASASRH